MQLKTQETRMHALNGTSLTITAVLYEEAGVMLRAVSGAQELDLFPDEIVMEGAFEVSDMLDRHEDHDAFREALITAVSWIADDFEYGTKYVLGQCAGDDVLFFENVTADRTPDSSLLGLEYDGSPIGIHIWRVETPTPQQLLTRCRYCGAIEREASEQWPSGGSWIEVLARYNGYQVVESITFSEDGGVSEFDIAGPKIDYDSEETEEVRCHECGQALDPDQLAAFEAMLS